MGWATDYCHTEMSAGGKTIYLTCQEVSAGNYQLKVECTEAMSGLGGSFCEVNGTGGYQLNAAGHYALSGDGKTITCDIESTSAPRVYTPLYVLIDGEKNFGDISDASWAACAGGDPTPDPDPEPAPVPDPDDHTAGGHTIHLDASYVDIDGTNKTYTLVISSTDNMQGLGGSFWNVNGVGADMRTNAGTSSYTVSGDKKTITCQVQSNSAPNIYTPLYVLMPGEISFGNVTLNWEDRTPIASEYCGQAMSSGNTLAKFTWETTAEGNVNITIIEALGGAANATYFRGNGITADKIKIGEGREAITTYFTHPGNINTQQTLTLTLTDPANAPAPGTKIYVENQIIEYATSKDGNAWPTLSFEYTYGGVCAEEKVLTEISLSAAAKFAMVGEDIALTVQPLDQMGMPIEATVDLEVSPADAGAIVGNVFTFSKTGAATITAKSGDIQNSITLYGVPSANLALNQPSEGGYYDNNPAEGFDKANDGNNNTAWVTYADKPASVEWWYVDLGAIYSLTGINVLWGDPSSTSYKLFARTEAPSEDDKANDAAWEEIASVSGIGINSEQFNVVSVNARYVRVHSLTKSANYLRMKEVSVFGTEYVPVVDTEAPVMTSASFESATFTEAVINVAATDNIGIYRFHVVDDANGIDANYAEADGKITVTGLTHATNYNFTITAKDAAGNESENNKEVAVSTPFDGSINLALNQPCKGGYYDNNPVESADKANDGNNGTSWVTYGDHAAALDWWVVDLGKVYNLTNITALWANDAYATHYMLQARVDAPTNEDKADDAAWVTLETVSGVTAGEERSTNVSGVGRYVRFRALAHTGFFRLREFRVYASGVAEVDTEAPVMSSASLVSAADNHAIIAVAATDNVGIAKYHVVDAGNSFDANFVAEGGNITVTGLTGGTNYNLAITAIDFFGNESANSKSVEVTTTAHYTEPQAACAVPTWDASLVKAIYSPTYNADCNFANWGGCVGYTQEDYGKKYEIGACGFFGVEGFNLNCLLMEKLHYDIWVENDATIRIVPIWGGAEQGISVNLIGQQWNSVDLTKEQYNVINDWSNIYQVKIDQASNLTIWVANAYFYRETVYVDTEAPTNVSASKVAEGFYSVSISAQAEDNSGAVSFKVMNGDVQLATGAAASGAATTIVVNGLASGTNYNFNVVAYDEAGNEAEPVAVAAATKFMPAPAPAPNLNGKNVVNVFSDAIAGSKTINSGGWGETTQVEWLDIAPGDKVFYGQNFNYAGWHSWGADIDATNMMFLHVDVYSTGMTSVSVTPISHDPTSEGSAAIALTPNAWTSADIALSAYPAVEWNKIFQFKFMNPVGGNELMIDNVYFWQPKVTALPVQGGDEATGGWATFSCAEKVAVPDGMKAYKAAYEKTAVEEVLTLNEVSVIPAGEGVILRGEAGQDYVFSATDADASDMSGNSLVGCPVRTDVSAVRENNEIFCMRYSELFSMTGFFIYEGQYVPAGKAYLALPKLSQPSSAPRRVRFVLNSEQVATGMDAINSQPSEISQKFIENGQMFIRRGDAVYTIQGTRVK